jgi:hypothetical protein
MIGELIHSGLSPIFEDATGALKKEIAGVYNLAFLGRLEPEI